MGDIGTPSRILAGKFGAPFTFATFHHERTLAPGQLSFEQMRDVYQYDKIDAETEVYGVIGDPIGHSLSPLIHNAAFRELGLNKVYLPFRIPREDLASFLDDAGELGIKGRQPGVDFFEVVGRLAKVVQADDPLGLAVPRNRRRRVFLQVDIVHAFGDGAAQEHPPLFFRTAVFAAVLRSPQGQNHRTRPLGQ
jgi:hypothetical protein